MVPRFLQPGKELDFSFDGDITYKIQREPKGIAHAIRLAEGFIEPGEKFIVILGDNIYGGSLRQQIEAYQKSDLEAQVFLKPVQNPERYANPEMDSDIIVDIEEKPDDPNSTYAITGCYGFYNDRDNSLFRFIDRMEPSDRGEYEVTDILNWYLDRGELGYEVLDQFWIDAGKPDALAEATRYMELRNREAD
ncbi:MAG: sugar phosphate nucleotidyltransferase [Candidatus Nanohaloarchaea archaeon]